METHILAYVLLGHLPPPSLPSFPTTEEKLPYQSLGPVKNFEFMTVEQDLQIHLIQTAKTDASYTIC